jgi:hypothetical protein
VVDSGIAEGVFVQLAQLRQLTSLYYNRVGVRPFQFLQCKVRSLRIRFSGKTGLVLVAKTSGMKPPFAVRL